MIGIKGVAKKPIIDATAVSSDILSGKVAYNNNGKVIGSISNSTVLKEFVIRVPAGTYDTPRSLITYDYPRGNNCNCRMDNSYGTQMIQFKSSDTNRTASGVSSCDNPVVYIAEGLFPNDLYSKYRPCGVKYIGTDRHGNPASEEVHIASTSHFYNVEPPIREFEIKLDLYLNSTWDENYDGELIENSGYRAPYIYIFNNYWTLASYDSGNVGMYRTYMKSVTVSTAFNISILMIAR